MDGNETYLQAQKLHKMKVSLKDGKNILLPLLIVMSLMFLWNMSRNINDVLIPHLKRACQLTDLQSSLVQSAFFGAYFLLSIPAGRFIQRFGYRSGMIAGLGIAAAGAILFYPAAEIRYYPLFLLALFIMATGFTFLEVTATPYISKLGDAESASSRLSLSAAVGSLGATIAPYASALLLLHEQDIPQSVINSYSPGQLQSFLQGEAALVKTPYLLLAGLFLILALVLMLIKLPLIAEENQEGQSFRQIFQFSHTIRGVFGVFCYVGAEVGIVSFLIRYAKSLELEGLTEQKAAIYVSVFMALVLAGRLAGTFILKRFTPSKVLLLSSGGPVLLLVAAMLTSGYISIWSLALIGLFTSVMYPILFTLSIKELGGYTKTASSLLIMGIVGGAIVPPLMGWISDSLDIRWAFIAPVICYLYIFHFGWKGHIVKTPKTSA
jgi:FHS family L-fucose permease-like MFS transporter